MADTNSTLQAEIDQAIAKIAERLYDEMKAPRNTGEAKRLIARALQDVREATSLPILRQMHPLLRHAALEGMSVRRDVRTGDHYIEGAAGSRAYIAEEIVRRMMVPDDIYARIDGK
jgi:hypothetical protein